MSAIIKAVDNPAIGNTGSIGIQKTIIYIAATGISTLFGIWANSAIKAKMPPNINPAIIDGLQIGGGVGIACIKNPIAQSIGVGQGIAGVVGLTQKGISYVRGKMGTITPPNFIVDGW